ncbi:MAG: hypothetical protein KF767_18100 [Bdellovibrionaceae bacterium]|nr:hypothetical protein [Pseudobdellovibrionaceae bacterium]
MLSEKKFLEGMNKLGEVQPKVLVKARLLRYLEAVRDLNDKQFERLVNHFLDTMGNWPPTPDEFRSAAMTIKNTDADRYFKEEARNPATEAQLQEILNKYGVKTIEEAVRKAAPSQKKE